MSRASAVALVAAAFARAAATAAPPARAPVKLRFHWLNTDTETPRWEQALSADGGQSWEINWTMDFQRA